MLQRNNTLLKACILSCQSSVVGLYLRVTILLDGVFEFLEAALGLVEVGFIDADNLLVLFEFELGCLLALYALSVQGLQLLDLAQLGLDVLLEGPHPLLKHFLRVFFLLATLLQLSDQEVSFDRLHSHLGLFAVFSAIVAWQWGR